MALCKLHHAAFDSFLLGVTPDYLIIVREDILDEVDGPILKHGLQELHKTKIILPLRRTEWPSKEALEWRYEQFQVSIP
jgi:putative restriction endonuclease